jgi:hypothetical protein
VEVLHPLADTKNQIVKGSQAVSKLCIIEGVSDMLSGPPRRMVRRRFATQISQRVEDGRGGSGIHRRVEKVPQGRSWRPGNHCHAIELRVHRDVRGSREELSLKARGGENGGRVRRGD